MNYAWNKETLFKQRLITEEVLEAMLSDSQEALPPFLGRKVYASITLGSCILYLVGVVDLAKGLFKFFCVDRKNNPESGDFEDILIETLAQYATAIAVYSPSGDFLGHTPSGAYRNPHFSGCKFGDIPQFVEYLSTQHTA